MYTYLFLYSYIRIKFLIRKETLDKIQNVTVVPIMKLKITCAMPCPMVSHFTYVRILWHYTAINKG